MSAQDFWNRVRFMVTKNKTTQVEIAKACNISYNTLHGWILKNIYPPVIDAYNIAKTLGVTVDYLMAGKSTEEQKIEVQIKGVKDLLQHAETKLDKMMPTT
ncbi:helix-turn-helix domain-containing protein [Leadbettera azotonutricia]|uniref:Putative transcriptional regulator n=1 Tax=Leadbettera azotonutricia (strain ATCC BAA-888 / DSM 13862 / ZAS-9) TaxID=545695 RepID=F5YFT9_LEAAZ|nr:helix-turn-helix transcriptional regulator [Leadbettera azotonutricia]AEF80874.1 putative transcriptional regulator [Leadbettera azotonutricia ZAS-9]